MRWYETSRPMPLLQLPLRSAVLEHGDARVLWSPSSTFDDETLRGLGTITDIVAPNLVHTDGVVRAARLHPSATLWGPAGIEAHQPSVTWRVFGRDEWVHEAWLSRFSIDGMPEFNEQVFIEQASSTLLVADLVFNITDPQGLGARLILSLFGTWKRFGVSRLYVSKVRDRAAFEASLARLLSSTFSAIAPAHGAVFHDDARGALLSALQQRGYCRSL